MTTDSTPANSAPDDATADPFGIARYIRHLEHDLAEAQRRLAGLITGPYGVRSCRGHWHVTADGHDLVTDAGDALANDIALEQAAKLNAEWHLSGEADRADAERWRKLVKLVGDPATAAHDSGISLHVGQFEGEDWAHVKRLFRHPYDCEMAAREIGRGPTLALAIDTVPVPEPQ